MNRFRKLVLKVEHSDGNAGLNGFLGSDKTEEQERLAHVRRKFVDGGAAQGLSIAKEAIRRIGELYAVEKETRGRSPAEHLAFRQGKAKPVFVDPEEWLGAQLPKISGKSPLT